MSKTDRQKKRAALKAAVRAAGGRKRHDTPTIVPPRRQASGNVSEALAKETVARGRLKVFDRPLKPDEIREATAPLKGSALGRLRNVEAISEGAYQAGKRYAEDVSAYARAKGLPPRHAKTCAYAEPIKGQPADMDPERVRRLQAIAEDAAAALNAAGAYVKRVVDRVALDDEDIGPSMVLDCGLRALAVHYGERVEDERAA